VLAGELAKKYRRAAATVKYLALDRVDLQFAAGVLGRTAARPTIRMWSDLKKVARYLVSHPRVVLKFDTCRWQEVPGLIAYSDIDWAVCKTSRWSASGGIIVLGGCAVKCWSNRQAGVALSSGEA
jgi:hypothetical protein